MKASILTATYNSSKTLEDCLQSTHSQTHPHRDHIIIDGGSTDGTIEVIKKYKNQIALPISAQSGLKDLRVKKS